MIIDKVEFVTPAKIRFVEREKVIKLLEKNKLQELRSTGVIDVNGRELYQGDNVKFSTYTTNESAGVVKFVDSSWVIKDLAFLFGQDEHDLTDRICVEYHSNKAGQKTDQIHGV